MNLKISFLTVLTVLFSFTGVRAETGISAINQRHYVICGVDADYNYLSRVQEGHQIGFDADICRAFAQAVLQNAEGFRLVPVKSEKVGTYLNSGKIDVMLGHNVFSPQVEIAQNITPVDVMYYDRIVFAARRSNASAHSMKEYVGSKVCVQDKSAAFDYVKKYNVKYALGFSFIKFPLLSAVKEAFYLNRCQLVAGDEVFVKSIVEDLHSGNPEVLPEEIGVVAVNSYTAAGNHQVNIAFKSVINALKAASSEGMVSSNVETFQSDSAPSIQNMLGINPKIWKQMKISQDWLSRYIKNFGSYSEILERNLGSISPLKLDINHNLPYNQGGLITFVPML